MNDTLILGGSGGLGREVMQHFPDAIDWSLLTYVDLGNHPDIVMAAARLTSPICRIINCAGINILRPIDDIQLHHFDHAMRVNAFALPLVVKTLRRQAMLNPGAIICNVISNASHIPMTHSLVYNASKAAQEMITRQMAREFKGKYSIFGVSPNKLKGTPMSRQIEQDVCKLRGWPPEEAERYQLAALPAGVETPPKAVARFIAELMRPEHHPFITGCIFPYGGP